MGFSLSQDIFGPGAPEQQWFRNFPIQVALLFRPDDVEFCDAVRRSFARLSSSTASDVVFFAPLNPPSHWKSLDRSGHARGTYTDRALSLDEPVLVYELARRLGVAWGVLPVLIASTDLWGGGFVTAATAAGRFAEQFEAMTDLVRRTRFGRGRRLGFENHDILETLLPLARDGYAAIQEGGAIRDSEAASVATADQLESEERNARHEASLAQVLLNQLSDVQEGVNHTWHQLRSARESLERSAALLSRTRPADPDALAELQRLAAEADPILGELRNAEAASESLLPPLQRGLARQHEAITAQAVAADKRRRLWLEPAVSPLQWLNRMLGPSALTSLLFRGVLAGAMRRDPFELPWSSEGFDEEGRVMLTSAAVTARALRDLETSSERAMDFSAALLGLYKAIERQVNMSLVQAVRKTRDIPMPSYFCKWDPNCPATQSVVATGTDDRGHAHRVDVNERRADKPDGHRFLGLGDSLHVVRTLNDGPTSRLAVEFRAALGQDLPTEVLTRLNAVRQARNRTVHDSRLSSEECAQLASDALSAPLLTTLRSIKDALAQPQPS